MVNIKKDDLKKIAASTERRANLLRDSTAALSSNIDPTLLWKQHIHPTTTVMRMAGPRLNDKQIEGVLDFIGKCIKVLEKILEKEVLSSENIISAYLNEWLGDLWRYRLHFSNNKDKEAVRAAHAFYLQASLLRSNVGRIFAELGVIAYKSKDYLEAIFFLSRARWSQRPAEEAGKLMEDLLDKVRPQKTTNQGALMRLLRKVYVKEEIDSTESLGQVFRQHVPKPNLDICFFISIGMISAAASVPDHTGLVLRAMSEVAAVYCEKHESILMAFLLLEFIKKEELNSCLSLLTVEFWKSLSIALSNFVASASVLRLPILLSGFTLLNFQGDAIISVADWHKALASLNEDESGFMQFFVEWTTSEKSYLGQYIQLNDKNQFMCCVN